MLGEQSAGAAVTIRRLSETDIPGDLHSSLRDLLGACFSGYPDRSYFKLPPHLRFLAMSGGMVQAHVGVELRVIRVGDTVLRSLGVVDLCVRDGNRGRGLGSRLLAEVTDLAGSGGMDFVLLFADDDRLYVRNGWSRVNNPLSWVKIHEHRTLGVASSVTPSEMMVKAVGPRPWPTGEVDLLGHVF